MEKGSSCDFEAVEGVDLVVVVHCQKNIVRIHNESSKSCIIIRVRQPGFGVNQGVFVALFVVGLGHEERLPI